jgi:hypothetical protein
MAARDDLRDERIAWLTKAVKSEWPFSRELLEEDEALTARERAYEDAAKSVAAWMKGPPKK